MKKVLLIVVLLVGALGYGQSKQAYLRLGKLTTTEIDAIDVTDTTVVYTAYDTTLGIEVINTGSGWGPRIAATWATLDGKPTTAEDRAPFLYAQRFNKYVDGTNFWTIDHAATDKALTFAYNTNSEGVVIAQYRLNITGVPSSSIDLVDKAYADGLVSGLATDSGVVHLSGSETIPGNKNFSGSNTVSGSVFMNGTLSGSGTFNMINGNVNLPGDLLGANQNTVITAGSDPTGQATLNFNPNGVLFPLTATPTDIKYNGVSLLGGGTDNQTLAEVLAEGADGNQVDQTNLGTLSLAAGKDIIGFDDLLPSSSGSTILGDDNLWLSRVVTGRVSYPSGGDYWGAAPASYGGDANAFGWFRATSSALGGTFLYSLNSTGTPTNSVDLITKGYADANYSSTPADGSITNAKLADNAVTSTKILDNTILNADINSGAAIDAVKIALADSGTYFPTDNVEAGMQYLAAAVEAVPTLINSNDFTGATTTNVNSATGTKNYIDTAINNSLLLGSESFTTSRTGVLADANGVIEGNNGSAITYTIPNDATVAHPVGTLLYFEQTGAGDITFAYQSPATGDAMKTFGEGFTITFRKTAANTWKVQNASPAYVTQAEYDGLASGIQNNVKMQFNIVP